MFVSTNSCIHKSRWFLLLSKTKPKTAYDNVVRPQNFSLIFFCFDFSPGNNNLIFHKLNVNFTKIRNNAPFILVYSFIS